MKKRMDNKGFSLVELIIVIAIMAILIGIVGSQVIPYIEKSRVSKDKDVLDTCYTALQAAVAKEGMDNITGAKLGAIGSGQSKDTNKQLDSEIIESIGSGIKDNATLKDKLGSNAYKGGEVQFWFDSSDGFIAVSVAGTDKKKGQTLIISSVKTFEKETKGATTDIKDLATVKKNCGATASSSAE